MTNKLIRWLFVELAVGIVIKLRLFSISWTTCRLISCLAGFNHVVIVCKLTHGIYVQRHLHFIQFKNKNRIYSSSAKNITSHWSWWKVPSLCSLIMDVWWDLDIGPTDKKTKGDLMEPVSHTETLILLQEQITTKTSTPVSDSSQRLQSCIVF